MRRAAYVAGECGARLTLLHVVDAQALDALRTVLHADPRVGERVVVDAQEQLDAQAREIAEAGPAAIDAHVATGVPRERIAEAAAAADLVVLGARGTNRLRDLILGTTAERLLRTLRRPMLVVRRPARRRYRRVVVGMDFSDDALAALGWAARIAPHAEIAAVHAVDLALSLSYHLAASDDSPLRDYQRQACSEAAARLREAVRSVDRTPGRFDLRVQLGNPPWMLLRLATQLDADLVALGRHGRSPIEEMILGSTVRHVVGGTACDVLVAHAGRDG